MTPPDATKSCRVDPHRQSMLKAKRVETRVCPSRWATKRWGIASNAIFSTGGVRYEWDLSGSYEERGKILMCSKSMVSAAVRRSYRASGRREREVYFSIDISYRRSLRTRVICCLAVLARIYRSGCRQLDPCQSRLCLSISLVCGWQKRAAMRGGDKMSSGRRLPNRDLSACSRSPIVPAARVSTRPRFRETVQMEV